MSVKDDVARLKRLGNPRSPYWTKVQNAISRVIFEQIAPIFPNQSSIGEPEWHELPRGYQLKYLPNGYFELRCWKEGRSGRVLLYSFSNTFMNTRGMLDFAYDLHTGWLDEVGTFVYERYKAKVLSS